MLETLKLFRFSNFNYRYPRFISLGLTNQQAIYNELKTKSPTLIEIISFCLMPTHIHLILKQMSDNGISKYLSRVLNSYARYFNTKHKRVGPLWAGRFKNVLISNDEQLLHLTRYIHLNPTSANLVRKPEDWPYSSYREFIGASNKNHICSFENILNLDIKEYENFVLNRQSYQKEISKIKRIILDEYTG